MKNKKSDSQADKKKIKKKRDVEKGIDKKKIRASFLPSSGTRVSLTWIPPHFHSIQLSIKKKCPDGALVEASTSSSLDAELPVQDPESPCVLSHRLAIHTSTHAGGIRRRALGSRGQGVKQ